MPPAPRFQDISQEIPFSNFEQQGEVALSNTSTAFMPPALRSQDISQEIPFGNFEQQDDNATRLSAPVGRFNSESNSDGHGLIAHR